MIHPLLRSQIAQAARRMHAAGWVANHDGNVSARLGRDVGAHQRMLARTDVRLKSLQMASA